jgi:hypothetical protein
MPKYDLAISFAGEQRSLAESVARRLDASGYSIFYDDFELASLWGRDLTVVLGDVYAKQARYCLVIVSKDYVSKPWTNLERQNILSAFMRNRSGYVLCLKTDEESLPGLPDVVTTVSLASQSYARIYKLLVETLGPPDHDNTVSGLSDADKYLAYRVISACFRRAVFTRMHGQINVEAMDTSLRQIIGSVQPLIPEMSNPALQRNAWDIIRGIDAIERVVAKAKAGGSIELAREKTPEIDKCKLQIIDALLEMRRAADLAIQLPFSLQQDDFFTVEEADSKPAFVVTQFYPNSELPVSHRSEVPDPAEEPRFSVIGAACKAVHADILLGRKARDSDHEQTIMPVVRADVYKGLRDDPLARRDLESQLRDLPATDLTTGPHGKELRNFGVRTFPSGNVVGLFGVWPGHESDVYAIVVDDQGPDFFGLHWCSMDNPEAAKSKWEGLSSYESHRHEAQVAISSAMSFSKASGCISRIFSGCFWR